MGQRRKNHCKDAQAYRMIVVISTTETKVSKSTKKELAVKAMKSILKDKTRKIRTYRN